MPGLDLDILTRIVNVHWGGKQGFLYSGSDGMFTSSDGREWTKLKSSVPAVSLAWVDGVWIGCGPSGVWRSEDGAQTWMPVAVPVLVEVAAMKSETVDTDNSNEHGIFAGWLEDEHGENNIVYVSHDLGKTWTPALTLPTTVGDNGFEGISGISGCGGALFVCTIWQSSVHHHGDGKIYSSTDGHRFSPETVFGPGNITLPDDVDQFPRIGFTASAVGFDAQTKTYIAVGDKGILPIFGRNDSYLIYTISSSPSFGESAGTIADSGTIISDQGDLIGSIPSAAGGKGKHVTGSTLFRFGIGGAYINSEWKARFVPGGSQVLQMSDILHGGYVGSFCFKSDENDSSGGVFACTAFGGDKHGGVYLAEGASFAMTHSGTGIDIDGGRPRGAVAVGTIGSL